MPTRTGMQLTMMDDGFCEAAIISEDEWRIARGFGSAITFTAMSCLRQHTALAASMS